MRKEDECVEAPHLEEVGGWREAERRERGTERRDGKM